MSNWIHRLFNPHCEHCHDERETSKICQSCETLKEQLASTIHEKNRLLDRILERPNVETTSQPERTVTVPHTNIPWTVRRQMLEREDREKARLMKDAPVAKFSTEDLEKELDIVGNEREKSNAS
jgi:hypothetical protein